MNLIKTLQRSLLKLNAVDALIRIAIHEDTIKEFKAETSTTEFAKSHDLCG